MRWRDRIKGMLLLIFLPLITAAILKLPDIFYQKMDGQLEAKVQEKQYSLAQGRETMTLKQTIHAINSDDAVLIEESYAVSTRKELSREVTQVYEELRQIFSEEICAYFESVLMHPECTFCGFSFSFLQVADGKIYCGNVYMLLFQNSAMNVSGEVFVDANSGKILVLNSHRIWWNIKGYDGIYFSEIWETEQIIQQLERYYEGAFSDWEETVIYMDAGDLCFGVVKEMYPQQGMLVDAAELWNREPAEYVEIVGVEEVG